MVYQFLNRVQRTLLYLYNTEQSKLTATTKKTPLIDTTLTRLWTAVQGSGSAAVPPSIPGPVVAPSVPVTPPAGARAGWSNGDWLLASMYHHHQQQRLRDAALYRRDVTALWTAALQQQQQQTGRCHYNILPWHTSYIDVKRTFWSLLTSLLSI